ncbi:MAG: hypothetical protein AB7G44_01085 [Bacteroidia bacterium]
MTKEEEIEKEFQRILKIFEAACKDKLEKLNWHQSDLAKEMDISPSALCDFINGRENHSQKKIITCLYYLGLQLNLTINSFQFQAYTPKEKSEKKQK